MIERCECAEVLSVNNCTLHEKNKENICIECTNNSGGFLSAKFLFCDKQRSHFFNRKNEAGNREISQRK